MPSALAHPRGHLVPYPHPSCPILDPWVFPHSLDGITTTGVPRTRIRGGSVARGHAATPPTGPWPPAPGGSSRGDSAPAAAGSRPRAATLFTFRALYLFQEIIKAAHAGSEFGLK